MLHSFTNFSLSFLLVSSSVSGLNFFGRIHEIPSLLRHSSRCSSNCFSPDFVLLTNEWQTLSELKTDTSILKNYIDTYFNIDCIIELRILLNKNNTLCKQLLNIKISSLSDNIIPIIITINYLIKYDKNIFDLQLLKSTEINRTKEFYIQNKVVHGCINNIFNELKEYIINYRKSIN